MGGNEYVCANCGKTGKKFAACAHAVVRNATAPKSAN